MGLLGSCRLEIVRSGRSVCVWVTFVCCVWVLLFSLVSFIWLLVSVVAVRVCVPVVVGVQLMVMVVFCPAARLFVVCVPMIVLSSCSVVWNEVVAVVSGSNWISSIR